MVNGVWIPVNAELGGKEFPDEVLRTMRLAIKDGVYMVNVDQMIDRGTVTIHANTSPTHRSLIL